MKITAKKLEHLIKEELKNVLNETKKSFDHSSKQLLVKYIAYLRAMQMWFHSAHHVTRGDNFAGDHSSLYERLYLETQEEIDGAIEKSIGLTNDEGIGCVHKLLEGTLLILKTCKSPSEMNPREIAQTGLELEKNYINYVEKMFNILEKKGNLSLGLDDQLSASVNLHEVHVYLLQQRVKT